MSRPQPHSGDEPREEVLLRQARRHSRRGEPRRAMLALRECCFAARESARLWALYGMSCWRARRHEDALSALRQALWLRERDHDERRAGVLKTLLERLEGGNAPDSKRAA
jgi:Flp pilus assembly protein TadD